MQSDALSSAQTGDDATSTSKLPTQIGAESVVTDRPRSQTTTTGLGVDADSNSSKISSDPPDTADLADNSSMDIDDIPPLHSDILLHEASDSGPTTTISSQNQVFEKY